MVKDKIGEMYLLTWKNKGQNAEWIYAVVVKVFDGKIELLKQDGQRYMLANKNINEELDDIVTNQPTDKTSDKLYIDGRPAVSKKNIFGKYTFQPK